MYRKDTWAIKGGRMMKKIGGTDSLRPLQMCLASHRARAATNGTSFDFDTNQTRGGISGRDAG